MSSRLGQSGIEYLTTYGWMAVAVTVAGAALYPAVDMGCDVQIQNDVRTGGLAVEQAGVTQNGTFKVILDSDSREEILVESLNLSNTDQSLQVVSPRTVNPGGEITYPVGQIERTGTCQTYTMQVNFDKGPLKDQKLNLKVKGSLDLVETFASLLEITGDSITEIEILTSVKPTDNTMCIGLDCPTTSGPSVQGDEYVNYSGDEMTGTLKTSDIKSGCYGKECPTKKGSIEGFVNTEDGQVEGTLNVTEIKPLTEENTPLTFR